MPGKKKKSALPKQNRGFATTSIPKKTTPTETTTNDAATIKTQEKDNLPNKVETKSDSPSDSTNIKEQWEDNEDDAKLAFATKIYSLGQKESNKLIRLMENERRLANQFLEAEWVDYNLRNTIINKFREEEKNSPTSLPAITESKEKALVKIATAYEILERFGMRKFRIEECLRKAKSFELDDIFQWFALNGTEEEASFGYSLSSDAKSMTKDQYQKQEQQQQQSQLMSQTPTPPEPSNENVNKPKKEQAKSNDSKGKDEDKKGKNKPNDNNISFNELHKRILEFSDAYEGSMTQEMGINDTDDPIATWSELKFTTDIYKKDKTFGITDSHNFVKINRKLVELEQDLLFDQHGADQKLKDLHNKYDTQDLRRRLKLMNSDQEEWPKESTDTQERQPENAPLFPSFMENLTDQSQRLQERKQGIDRKNKKGEENGTEAETDVETTGKDKEDENAKDEDKDNGGKDVQEDVELEPESDLLGGMFEELPSEIEVNNRTIKVRQMELPKVSSGMGVVGKWPCSVLDDTLKKLDQFATVTYHVEKLSICFFASATIRWNGGITETFKMEHEAVSDDLKAKNYAATLALFSVAKGPVYRTIPISFRYLWEDLERRKKEQDDQLCVEAVNDYTSLYEERAGKGTSTPKPVKPTTTDSTGSQLPMKSLPLKDPEFYRSQIQSRMETLSYQEMMKFRSNLPIASYRDEIMRLIDSSQVIVLSGETGCGKSTQVPAYLMESQLQQGKHVKVLVTEPRRISAISLAKRVSKELGEPNNACGTRKSLVGYSIRLESKTSATTRLNYATTGVVLRMLEGNQNLDDITHIIIDEVHERSIDSDFLILLLKPLLEKRKDLKLILMSATVDSEKLSAYMDGCPTIQVPGRTFPVQQFFLEDALETTGYQLDSNSDSPYVLYEVRGKQYVEEDLDENTDDSPINVGDLSAYSQATRTTLSVMDERMINYDLIMSLLENICFTNPELQSYSSAILIFMPSLDTIRQMVDLLESHPSFGTQDFEIYPLHSSVSSENQSLVFNVPQAGVRKIVVSTNIAETGITISDITCVIDTGKHREMRYDEKRQISRLIESFIAKSNAKQRKGRAGRVQPGLCFHLFTGERYQQLPENPLPEMLRLSLQDLILRIKIMEFKDPVEKVFSQALDPPLSSNIQRAIESLKEVKALTINEEITYLGRHLIKMPMDVHMGKFLIYASLFSCLDPALCIAASMNSKSPFVTPFGKETEAEKAKQSFKVNDSDFLTIFNAYDCWRRACARGDHKSFCRKNFLSHSNLVMIEELRQQYLNYLIDVGFVPLQDEDDKKATPTKARVRFVRIPSALDARSDDPQVVMGCLAAAMYPKLLFVEQPSCTLKTLSNNATVSVHPSSVNFNPGRRPDFAKAKFATYYTIMQSKKLYVWQIGTVDEKAILLLCGDIDYRLFAQSISIDRKIKMRLSAKSSAALNIIRKKFGQILQARMKNPMKMPNEQQTSWFNLIAETIEGDKKIIEEEPEISEKPQMSISFMAPS